MDVPRRGKGWFCTKRHHFLIIQDAPDAIGIAMPSVNDRLLKLGGSYRWGVSLRNNDTKPMCPS